MNVTKLKAAIFDAEQAITFAREAIDEMDDAALLTALRAAKTQIDEALANVEAGSD